MDQQLKDLCIKGESGGNLDVWLAKYTKPELNKILELYGNKMPAAAKKQEMADKAEEVVKAGIYDYFTGEGSAEKQTMQDLCRRGATLTVFDDFEKISSFYNRGLVFLVAEDEAVRVVVPEDVAVIVEGLDDYKVHKSAMSPEQINTEASQLAGEERMHREADMDRTENEKEIIKYAGSLARMYGVYSPTQLKEVWDFNHERGISPSDVAKALDKSGDSDGFYINDSYIINTSLTDIEAYCDILDKLERSDTYFYPYAEEVEAFADGYAVETTPEYHYLRSFAERKTEDSEKTDALMKDLYLMTVRDAGIDEVTECLRAYDVKLEDSDESDLFTKLYTRWFYVNRIWVCKGYKPSELRPEKLQNRSFKLPMNEVTASQKPGRNDKCPCGSGKKYKNCCSKYID